MPKIESSKVWEAKHFLIQQNKGPTAEVSFRNLGVTNKQWRKFVQTGHLSVSHKTRAKIDVLSSCYRRAVFLLLWQN